MSEKRGKSYPVKIDRLVRNLLQKWTSISRQQDLIWNNLWKSAVGEKIAAHTAPLELKQGKLIVAVENAAWMNELTYLKENIKMQTRKTFLDNGITLEDIIFKLGQNHRNHRRMIRGSGAESPQPK